MNVSDLEYPLMSFSQGDVFIQDSENDLTLCNKLAITKGFYRDQLLIDSNGSCLKSKQPRVNTRGIAVFGRCPSDFVGYFHLRVYTRRITIEY